jgi:protein involved in polysaccharide export with SLBB domain
VHGLRHFFGAFQIVKCAEGPMFKQTLFVAGIVAFVSTAEPAQAQDLPLVAGDTISIEIYGREDLSGERRLSGTGTVAVPLLGRVRAEGLSAEDLEMRVAQALEDGGLIQEPSVLVEIVRRGDVFVDGDVERPSAFLWRPGISVRQAVTLAGGHRPIDEDTLGTVLQAYTARENYEALKVRIATAEAEEARIMAEMAFTEAVIAPYAEGLMTKAEGLHMSSIAEDLMLKEATKAQMLAMGVEAPRSMDAEAAGFALVSFPDSVQTSVAHADLRATQLSLIEKRISLNLERFNALRTQAAALHESLDALTRQLPLAESRVAALEERFDAISQLQAGGLARANDVLSLQNALALAQTTQLETVRAIAETRNQSAQQDLALANFALLLGETLENDLAAVRTRLAEDRARIGPARRAAALAEAWRIEEVSEQTGAAPRYAILSRGAAEARPAEPTDLLRPGDTVLVTLSVD